MKPGNLPAKLIPISHSRAAGVHYLKGTFGVSDLSSQLFAHTSSELTCSHYRKTSGSRVNPGSYLFFHSYRRSWGLWW